MFFLTAKTQGYPMGYDRFLEYQGLKYPLIGTRPFTSLSKLGRDIQW